MADDALIEKDLESAIQDVLASLKPSDQATVIAAMHGERDESIPGATFRKRLERALGRARDVWRTKYASGS